MFLWYSDGYGGGSDRYGGPPSGGQAPSRSYGAGQGNDWSNLLQVKELLWQLRKNESMIRLINEFVLFNNFMSFLRPQPH